METTITGLSGLLIAYLLARHGLLAQFPQPTGIAGRWLDGLLVLLLALDVLPLYRQRKQWRHTWYHNWLDTVLLAVAIPATLLRGWGVVFVLFRQIVLHGRHQALSGFIDALGRRPIALLAASFASLVATGTALLLLPAATTDGHGLPFVNALFTAASAACVTGLTVIDLGSVLTRFGQVVVLVLIQLGGLGIMTFYAGLASALGVKLTLAQRRSLSMSVEQPKGFELAHTLRYVLLLTIVAELAGTALLYPRMASRFASAGESLFAATFHSISAFCNAGFGLFPDNLVSFQDDWLVNLTVIGLIVLGGIGFSVAHELISRRSLRRSPRATWRQITTHTRLVLVVTAFLIVLATSLFLVFEHQNALAGLPAGTKFLASLFQAVTPRTAGFNTVSLASLQPITILTWVLLMFIGASPGGTGGGIKTTTAAVLLLSVRSQFRGRGDVEYGGRTIPKVTVFRAAAVLVLSALALLLAFGTLLVTERQPFSDLLFETASAFGTVGLSTGITPLLSAAGKLVLAALMYVGRIGPLTFVLAMRARERTSSIVYPTTQIMVG
jgi:trk system potassium uptake protein TrkH